MIKLKCDPQRLPDRGTPTKDLFVKSELPDLPVNTLPGFKPKERNRIVKHPTKNTLPQRKDLWTPEMEKKAMQLYWAGESYENIGKSVGRSAKASKIRVNAIRKEKGQRPRRLPNSMFWQESEEKLLIEMYESGVGIKIIAEKLGRTYLAIATRIKVLRDRGIRIEKK